MRILLIVCAVVILWATTYGLYLHHRLKPLIEIMESPAAHLRPQPFKKVAVPEKRHVNLGYASISLPGFVEAEPLHMDSSGFISIGRENARAQILCCPPINEQTAEIASLLKSDTDLSGQSVDTFFAWKEKVLTAEPLSIREMVVFGKQKLLAQGVLLTTKSLLLSDTKSFSVFRTQGLGVILQTTPDRTILSITDLEKKIAQEFLIGPKSENIDAIVSALISDYQSHVSDASIDAIKRQIDQAGVRSFDSHAANSSNQVDLHSLPKLHTP